MLSFESLRDFREIKDVYLEEKLTQEEIDEGLEPYGDLFKVAITNHSYQRMNEEIDRFCDWEDIEDLLLEKSTQIINASQKEEFILLRDDLRLAIVCIIENIEGFSTIVLKTVIRKVFFDDNGNEKERRVFVDRNKNKVY